jgi:hypothetical protein
VTDTRPLCAEVDPALWFPEDYSVRAHSSEGRRLIAQAKSVCRECPLRAPCLLEGLSHDFGIFGGLTARERLRLRAGRGAA